MDVYRRLARLNPLYTPTWRDSDTGCVGGINSFLNGESPELGLVVISSWNGVTAYNAKAMSTTCSMSQHRKVEDA
jgi:hypothetical protein